VTRLSQIIAIEKDNKTRAEQVAFAAYKLLEKPEPLAGISRAYTPRDAEGEQLPTQTTRVQTTVAETLRDISVFTGRYLDLVGTKERTDQDARADVVVDGEVFIPDAPVTFLLALERQLNEEMVQAKKLPTLSPEFEWAPYDGNGTYVTTPITTVRSKKVPRNHVKAPATDKHPAQVEVYFEDTAVGDWVTKHFSGALPASVKQQIINRITKLLEAVKQAREEANTTTVTDYKYGNKVFGYIYGQS
jgi:hypothetical protein